MSSHILIRLVRFHLCNVIYFSTTFSTPCMLFIKFLRFAFWHLNTALATQRVQARWTSLSKGPRPMSCVRPVTQRPGRRYGLTVSAGRHFRSLARRPCFPLGVGMLVQYHVSALHCCISSMPCEGAVVSRKPAAQQLRLCKRVSSGTFVSSTARRNDPG